MNNVSFTDQYMQHSELNGSKYCLNLSCSFFQDRGPALFSKIVVLKPALQQSDSGTSPAM